MEPAAPSSARRISVVRGRDLVPLLSSAHPKISAEQPWKGTLLERHQVHPGEIPEHEHPHLCLHLQLSGNDRFEWWSDGKNRVEETQPGSMILLPAGTRDRLRWHGSSERIILSLDQSAFAGIDVHNPEFAGQWAFTDPALRHLITEMGNEAVTGWPLGSLYADLLSLGFQKHLLRRHSTTLFAPPPAKGGLSLQQLRRTMDYIHANLSGEVHLDEIAHQLDLSPSHFAHEFRSSTGQTPYQYLLDQRMAMAKDLLRNRDWSVQYISGIAGFKSPVNFVRAFRQRVGLTPEAWRRDNAVRSASPENETRVE